MRGPAGPANNDHYQEAKHIKDTQTSWGRKIFVIGISYSGKHHRGKKHRHFSRTANCSPANAPADLSRAHMRNTPPCCMSSPCGDFQIPDHFCRLSFVSCAPRCQVRIRYSWPHTHHLVAVLLESSLTSLAAGTDAASHVLRVALAVRLARPHGQAGRLVAGGRPRRRDRVAGVHAVPRAAVPLRVGHRDRVKELRLQTEVTNSAGVSSA